MHSHTLPKALLSWSSGKDSAYHLAFGDLFLSDIRAYREEMLTGTGLEPIFPLWGVETTKLATAMIAAGIQAVITCVDRARLDASLAGVPYDEKFLSQLPSGVDPCGENGEFHTLVWNGPGFVVRFRSK